MHGNLLLLVDAGDGIRLFRQLGLESLVLPDEIKSRIIERRRRSAIPLTEGISLRVVVDHGQPRLRRAKRDRLAVELEPRGEDRVFQRVVALDELGREEPAFARLPQPVQALARVSVGPLLLVFQRIQLLAAEDVGVARDDRRLLRYLLLADPDGPAFL